MKIKSSISLTAEELRRLDLQVKKEDRSRSYLIGKWAITLPKE